MRRWLRIATTALALTIPGAVLPAAQAADPAVQITFTTQPKVTFSTGLTGQVGAVTFAAWRVSRPSTVAVRILDASGAVVRTLVENQSVRDASDEPWYFKDAAGQDVPEGDYTMRVEAVDGDGNRDVEDYAMPLDRHTVVPLQGVIAGFTYSTNVTMSIAPKPGITLANARFLIAEDSYTGYCAISDAKTPGSGGRIQATVDVSDCGDHVGHAGAFFEFTDRIGAKQKGYTPMIPVRVADRSAPVVTLAPYAPASQTLHLRNPGTYETSKLTYWVRDASALASQTYQIRNGFGITIASGTLTEGGGVGPDALTRVFDLRWSSTRNDGSPLPAGRYRVVTRFTDAGGHSAAGPATTIDLDATIPGGLAATRIDGYNWEVVVTPKSGEDVTGVAVSTAPANDNDPHPQVAAYDAATGTYRTVVSLAKRSPGTYPVRALITRGTAPTATTFTTADQGLVVLPDTEAPVVTPPTTTHLYLRAPDQYAPNSFEFAVSDQSTLRSSDFLVSNATGSVVDHVVTDGAEGRTSFQWNGTGPQGERLPAGDYVVRTSFTDAAGNVTPASTTVHLDDTVPATMAIVGRTGNAFTVEVTPTPGVSLHIVAVWLRCCMEVPRLDPSTGTYRGTIDLTGQPPGTYQLDGEVSRDTPGAGEGPGDGQGWFYLDPVTVTVTD